MSSTTKKEFAEHIRADADSWRELAAAVGPDRWEEPGPMGDWSFRDLAGHLLAWRNRTIARFEAANRGEPEPPTPWPADLEDDDPINDWIRDHDRDRSTDELVGGYEASYERLATAVAAMPDRLFEDPAAMPWLGGTSVSDGDFTSHLHEEHEPTVREWLRQTNR